MTPTKKSWRDVLPIHPAADMDMTADFAARLRARDEARFPRLKEIKTHPALDFIPLMNEAEFTRLVWSIRKIGLVDPIVEDDDGRILDGRCRFLACEIAGVEPRLAPPKDSVVAYLFAKNIARRHLNEGQRAMIIVMMEKQLDDNDGFVGFILSANFVRRHLTPNELHIADAMVEEPDYPATLVSSEARLIVRHADLAKRVGRGLSLGEAHEIAVEREHAAAKQAEDHQRLGQLRGEAPFLAAQVDEGALTLDEAAEQAVEIAAAPLLAEHAQAIRSLGRRMIADTVEIGRRLAECRRLIRRDWIAWLDREFGLSDRMALNFIRVHELALARSENFSDLDLPVSGLYLLARPSTPESARDSIIKRAAAGEVLSLDDIRHEIGIEKPAGDLHADVRKIAEQLAQAHPDDLLVQQLQSLVAGRPSKAAS
jgi:Protein of unknown function (DUF3102)